MPDIQKYMTLTDCPYCHETSATEMAKNPCVVRCNTCGLWRFYPRMDREGQISYLKKINNEINPASWANPLDHWKYSANEVHGLKRNFPDMFPDGKILDVGTGEGSFLYNLQQSGVLGATGLEPMEKLAQLGKSAGLDIHVGQFETQGMPPALAERIFDLVCFREVIYYLADWREAFDLLRRVLRPGGGLYIKCHVPTSIYYWKSKNYSRYGSIASAMPTLKATTKILINEGYEILETGYFPFNVLYTLGWLSAYSILGRIVSYGILSPMLRVMGKADRMFILAKRL